MAEQCFRFLNSDLNYSERELHLLLRAIQTNPLGERLRWFTEVHGCRRRAQRDFAAFAADSAAQGGDGRNEAAGMTLAKVFRTQDELDVVEYRAMITKIRLLIKSRNMLLLDAFRAWDYDRNNFLNCSELYGGLTWLGMDLTPPQIYNLMRSANTERGENFGMLSFKEFATAFADPDLGGTAAEEVEREALEFGQQQQQQQQLQSGGRVSRHASLSSVSAEPEVGSPHSVSGVSVSDLESEVRPVEEELAWVGRIVRIPPRYIRELYDLQTTGSRGSKKAPTLVSAATMSQVKVRVAVCPRWREIWNSRATTARSHMSIWAPAQSTSWPKVKYRACLGHYSAPGFTNPKRGKLGYTTLELSGQSRDVLQSVAAQLMPHPVRFLQVWRQDSSEDAAASSSSSSSSSSSLYLWRPIPPSEGHVALGFIATLTPEEPDPSVVHCVPRGWLVSTKTSPVKIWDDSGTGGRAGSIWKMSSNGIFSFALGHEAPDPESHFDFWKKEFWASEGVSEVKWDADSTTKECHDCKAPFTWTRRRHHCRLCGHIFCGKCSSGRRILVEGQKAVRVCDTCKERPLSPEEVEAMKSLIMH